MKFIASFTVMIALFAATGCGTSADEPKADMPSVLIPDNTNSVTIPATSTIPPASVPVTPTVAPGNSAAVALNPAHGQPGHNCDIAVGAPLTTQPIKAELKTNIVQPTVSSPTVITTAPASKTTNPTSAALNPAHGQPGHRCDIAVGAPLNSQPVTAQPVINLPTSPKSALPYTPVVPAPTVNTKGVAGINPAHGQPGHRCDIAVGAPLTSSPTTPKVETAPITPAVQKNPAVLSSANPRKGSKAVDQK